jgi:hypothetical protein
LAIEGKVWTPNIEHLPLKVFHFTSQAFSARVETHNFEGVILKVYSSAKTVVDCFKFRNKIGIDVAIEALRDC